MHALRTPTHTHRSPPHQLLRLPSLDATTARRPRRKPHPRLPTAGGKPGTAPNAPSTVRGKPGPTAHERAGRTPGTNVNQRNPPTAPDATHPLRTQKNLGQPSMHHARPTPETNRQPTQPTEPPPDATHPLRTQKNLSQPSMHHARPTPETNRQRTQPTNRPGRHPSARNPKHLAPDATHPYRTPEAPESPEHAPRTPKHKEPPSTGATHHRTTPTQVPINPRPRGPTLRTPPRPTP
ncbi:hypothetical protein FB390_1740 [Nocardia bhagyanarayanae]|uniref:Uncharacterized protein n=1 Tax=Nocardia bhagyanarayanae TaxID=1215925 RepID=A0A543F8G5_9NOCA|nr:hypothetical protein FB390_1740 [Nocardia bhagyanarayanae]